MSWVKKTLRKFKPHRGALWLAVFMLAVWYALVGHNYVFLRVSGDSMVPTYENKEIIIIEKPNSTWQPERNDVIVFLDGDFVGAGMCKRVIGIEGDRIRFGTGMIYLNGKKLLDPIDTSMRSKQVPVYKWNMKTHEGFLRFREPHFIEECDLVVPKGYVWVVGDNRAESWQGLVKIKDITGKVII